VKRWNSSSIAGEIELVLRNVDCVEEGPADAEVDPDGPEMGPICAAALLVLGVDGLALVFVLDDRVLVWSEPGWKVLFASPVAEDWMRVARDGGGFVVLAGLGLDLSWVLDSPRMFGFSGSVIVRGWGNLVRFGGLDWGMS
jgi:hypothetical protein